MIPAEAALIPAKAVPIPAKAVLTPTEAALIPTEVALIPAKAALIPTEVALIPAKAAISRSPWINYWIAASPRWIKFRGKIFVTLEVSSHTRGLALRYEGLGPLRSRRKISNALLVCCCSA